MLKAMTSEVHCEVLCDLCAKFTLKGNSAINKLRMCRNVKAYPPT